MSTEDSPSHHWYRFYPGDFARDTRLLSLEEKGAYRELIDFYFSSRGPIPTDPHIVQRILGVSLQKTRKFLTILSPFFVEKDGFLFHKKIEKEIAKSLKRHEAAVTAGKASAATRATTDRGTNQNQNQNHKDIYVDANASTLSSSQKSEKRLNGVPYKKIIDAYHRCLPDNPKVVAITDKRKSHIRTIAKKHEMRSVDDWEKYFTFCNQSLFLTGKSPPSANRNRSFIADIDFLINETNFVKIAEKKYHGGSQR